MENENTYPNRLKEIREEHGLSQREAAKELGIATLTYQRYEYGIRDIPGDILIKINDLFGVSSDYVLKQTDQPKYEYHFIDLGEQLSNISSEENRIIKALALLNENGKRLLCEIAEALITSDLYKMEK